MNILLITPYSTIFECRWMPLGPCYMAALLIKNGHKVGLFDRTVEYKNSNHSADSINNLLKITITNFKPQIIGLSTNSLSIYDTIDCIKFIRTFYQHMIIVGGHHATSLPMETLEKIDGIDAVVIGEGEAPILALAQGERNNIPGVIFSSDGGGERLTINKIDDLDSLPFPAIDILDLNYYLKSNTSTIRGFNLSVATLLTSRGCSNNCTFCSESLTFGSGVRYHSPEYVIENMRQLRKYKNINGIYFHDNNFIENKKRVEEICKRIIDNGFHKSIKWAIQARVDSIDAVVLKLLKKAGCVKIEIGIESLEQNRLNDIRKNIDIGKIYNCVLQCRKNGIKVHGYFMHGYENEKLSDLKNQLKQIKKLRLDTVHWGKIGIFPGTYLYSQKGNNFFENNTWNVENIARYYRENVLSNISTEEKEVWIEKNYRPYQTFRNYVSLIRNNSVGFILRRGIKKISKLFRLPF